MAPAPPAPPTPPAPQPPALLTAWPRSAQLAAAFLVGAAAALLVVHGLGHLRGAARPTRHEPGSQPSYQIDLNQADRAELLQLPGVGESLAGRILDYREEHGGFRDVEELRRVQGIGPATMDRLRPWVCVAAAEEPDGEEESPSPPSPPPGRKGMASPPRKATGGKKAAGLTGKIDVNRAGVDELRKLPNIGPKRAQAIVEEREKAPFRSVDDLRRVHGIGPAIVAGLRPHVTVGPPPGQLTRAE